MINSTTGVAVPKLLKELVHELHRIDSNNDIPSANNISNEVYSNQPRLLELIKMTHLDLPNSPRGVRYAKQLDDQGFFRMGNVIFLPKGNLTLTIK